MSVNLGNLGPVRLVRVAGHDFYATSYVATVPGPARGGDTKFNGRPVANSAATHWPAAVVAGAPGIMDGVPVTVDHPPGEPGTYDVTPYQVGFCANDAVDPATGARVGTAYIHKQALERTSPALAARLSLALRSPQPAIPVSLGYTGDAETTENGDLTLSSFEPRHLALLQPGDRGACPEAALRHIPNRELVVNHAHAGCSCGGRCGKCGTANAAGPKVYGVTNDDESQQQCIEECDGDPGCLFECLGGEDNASTGDAGDSVMTPAGSVPRADVGGVQGTGAAGSPLHIGPTAPSTGNAYAANAEAASRAAYSRQKQIGLVLNGFRSVPKQYADELLTLHNAAAKAHHAFLDQYARTAAPGLWDQHVAALRKHFAIAAKLVQTLNAVQQQPGPTPPGPNPPSTDSNTGGQVKGRKGGMPTDNDLEWMKQRAGFGPATPIDTSRDAGVPGQPPPFGPAGQRVASPRTGDGGVTVLPGRNFARPQMGSRTGGDNPTYAGGVSNARRLEPNPAPLPVYGAKPTYDRSPTVNADDDLLTPTPLFNARDRRDSRLGSRYVNDLQAEPVYGLAVTNAADDVLLVPQLVADRNLWGRRDAAEVVANERRADPVYGRMLVANADEDVLPAPDGLRQLAFNAQDAEAAYQAQDFDAQSGGAGTTMDTDGRLDVGSGTFRAGTVRPIIGRNDPRRKGWDPKYAAGYDAAVAALSDPDGRARRGSGFSDSTTDKRSGDGKRGEVIGTDGSPTWYDQNRVTSSPDDGNYRDNLRDQSVRDDAQPGEWPSPADRDIPSGPPNADDTLTPPTMFGDGLKPDVPRFNDGMPGGASQGRMCYGKFA